MSDQLTEMGIEADSELVRFDEIQSIEAITPKFSGDSRLMTELRFTVKISTRNYVFRQTPSPEPSASPTPDAPDHTIAPTQAPLANCYAVLFFVQESKRCPHGHTSDFHDCRTGNGLEHQCGTE